MKILLQNQYDGPLGGVETYFQLLVQTLLEKGHEVIAVYTFCSQKAPVSTLGYKAFYLPDLDLPEDVYYSKRREPEIRKSLLALKEIVRQEKPDVIHLNNTYYPKQFSFLRRYAPLVQTTHDFFNCCSTVLKMRGEEVCTLPSGLDCFRKKCVSAKSIHELWRFKTKHIHREAMKGFDKQLVATEYMKDMLVSNGFDESKVEVVPLFVEDWGPPGEPQTNTILYVGRLTPEKGVLHFIHMLKLLQDPFTACLIGEGPQRRECERLVQNMGIEDKVAFTGFLSRQELQRYYSRSLFVVVPSLWPEPFCLVGLEAMSSARPVVAYDVGGIPSWLKDNYNGYLVQRGDIKGLLLATETLLKNQKKVLDMGWKGRHLFEEQFTKKVHFSKLLSVYEKLVKEKRTARQRPLKISFFPMKSKKNKISAKEPSKPYPVKSPQESLPDYNKRLIEFEVQNRISHVKSYPEEITISTTARCNMEPPCVMCERNLRTSADERDLDEKVFEMLMPIFKHADRIYLHCGGEPLMSRKSYEIIKSVSPPTKIIFNTNGALFTETTIKHMVDCGVVDVISFSIDAATEQTYKKIRSADFNKIIQHVKTLVAYRNLKNKHKPLLRPLVLLNCCILRQNIQEVPDFVVLAHSLGVDGIDFSHMNAGFDWKQEREGYVFDYKNEHVINMQNKEEHDERILKAYELGKKLNMAINFNGKPFVGELVEAKVKILNEISELVRWEKKCIAPWNRAVIEVSGTVRMCYFHDSLFQTIGKLKGDRPAAYYKQKDKFEDIWNGEVAVSVRKEFISRGIAQRCITKNPCIFQGRI